MASGCRGTPCFSSYDRELVLKPAISLQYINVRGATVERLTSKKICSNLRLEEYNFLAHLVLREVAMNLGGRVW